MENPEGKLPRVGNIVKRGERPAPVRKKRLRNDVLKSLLRDFERRCAYCLQREAEEEGFKIDHHFPTSKGGSWTDYDNLFLSCDRCNHHKGDWWPSKEQQQAGVRYLNCCREIDYAAFLFENEQGEIVCKDPAAIYHQRMLKLNRPDLVRLRLKRVQLFKGFEEKFCQIETAFDETSKALLLAKIQFLKQLLEDMIPKIPRPPKNFFPASSTSNESV